MENYDTNENFFAYQMIDRSVASLRDKLTRWGLADLQEVQGLDGWSTVFFCTKELVNSCGSNLVKFCVAYKDDDGTMNIFKEKECGLIYFTNAVTYLLVLLLFVEVRQADAVAQDDAVAEAVAVADVAEAKEDDAVAVAEEPALKRNALTFLLLT